MTELTNFFVQCRCGRDLRFDFIEQERICKCGRKVVIGPGAKEYLLERLAKSGQPSSRENPGGSGGDGEIPIPLTGRYRSRDGASIEFQALQTSSVNVQEDVESLKLDRIKIETDGERFTKANIRKETVEAFLKFFTQYKEALWRLT